MWAVKHWTAFCDENINHKLSDWISSSPEENQEPEILHINYWRSLFAAFPLPDLLFIDSVWKGSVQHSFPKGMLAIWSGRLCKLQLGDPQGVENRVRKGTQWLTSSNWKHLLLMWSHIYINTKCWSVINHLYWNGKPRPTKKKKKRNN